MQEAIKDALEAGLPEAYSGELCEEERLRTGRVSQEHRVSAGYVVLDQLEQE